MQCTAVRRNAEQDCAPSDGKPLKHEFNKIVLVSIFHIFDAVMNFKKDAIVTMCNKLDIKLAQDACALQGEVSSESS